MAAEKKLEIYHGKVISLNLETVILANGTEAELEIVHHPGGAAVVALDEERNVCLIRQFRHAAGGWLWELPAGKLEPNEPPLETAKRELAEEAGLAARDWRPLGKILSSPGVFTEAIYLFLAQGLVVGSINHETHEIIEVHHVPLARALEWAENGEIVDAKTLAGLWRASRCLRGRVSDS